ncbi:hypothetical protein Tco_0825890, partial [Tanacetum coccineum]
VISVAYVGLLPLFAFKVNLQIPGYRAFEMVQTSYRELLWFKLEPSPEREVRPVAVNQDGNKKSLMDNNLTRQQEKHGLTDPVQMMKMLAENAQHRQQHNNSNGFGSNRDDSTNVALTTAQAWMSLGGTGGFLKPPQTENPNPLKQISSDYNFGHDRQQRYQSLGSPVRQSTDMMVDSQQPNLALQL